MFGASCEEGGEEGGPTGHVFSAHHCVNAEEECCSAKELGQSFPLVVADAIFHTLERLADAIRIDSLHTYGQGQQIDSEHI